jgi:hypothetical protein
MGSLPNRISSAIDAVPDRPRPSPETGSMGRSEAFSRGPASLPVPALPGPIYARPCGHCAGIVRASGQLGGLKTRHSGCVAGWGHPRGLRQDFRPWSRVQGTRVAFSAGRHRAPNMSRVRAPARPLNGHCRGRLRSASSTQRGPNPGISSRSGRDPRGLRGCRNSRRLKAPARPLLLGAACGRGFQGTRAAVTISQSLPVAGWGHPRGLQWLRLPPSRGFGGTRAAFRDEPPAVAGSRAPARPFF